jgi:hypothetical protein
VGHDRESETNEESGIVRKRAETQEAVASSASPEFIHHPSAQADASSIAPDDERSHFRDRSG